MATAPPPAGRRFTGFSPSAVEFYRGLALDNSKSYWQANRAIYDDAVKGPLVALTDELAPEFGTFHLFRPHRDVRFSADKSPYKHHQGAVTEGECGEAYYVHVSADGLFVASGYYQMARDQLERFREAIDDDRRGVELERIVDELGRRYEIGGEALKTAPRGYPRDHPRVRLLRHKGLTAAKQFGTPAWLATRRAATKIAETWRGIAPLNEWLGANVGPSLEPPPEH
jgi:uncharacterized protein (TIGR02453 family)